MKKFNGNKYDMTQELGKFIGEELLEVYKIRGGRKMKYEEMKDQLLKFYKKSKVNGKSHFRSQLDGAVPHLNEAFDMYGMRLTELVKLAYPNSKTEAAKRLRQCFLSTIPTAIAAKITDAELALKATTNSKKKRMSFNSIMEMARDIQKSRDKNRSVMWIAGKLPDGSSPSSVSNENGIRSKPADRQPYEFHRSTSSSRNSPDQRNFVSAVPGEHRPRYTQHGHQSREFHRSASFSRSSPSDQRDYSHSQPQTGNCSYCRMANHSRENCWKASRSCLICGDKHHMEDCPRFDRNHRSQSRNRDGDHLND